MAHRIDDDVHADFVSHEPVLSRVARIVNPLPGIAQVTVACHKDHQPAVFVFDSHVMRRNPALLVRHSMNQRCDSGNLDHLVHIEIAVEDRLREWQILDLVLGKNHSDLFAGVLPFVLAMKVVKKKKADARTLESVESEISRAEQRLNEISQQMGTPEVARDAERLIALNEEYQQTEALLRGLYDEWDRVSQEPATAK